MAVREVENLYNRYVPSPDGGYQRHSVPDRPQPPEEHPGRLTEPPEKQEKPPETPDRSPEKPDRPPAPVEGCQSIGSFLEHLLPRGLDTEDLIVVLLLLLMSENCRDGTNTPLITMLIYLFL